MLNDYINVNIQYWICTYCKIGTNMPEDLRYSQTQDYTHKSKMYLLLLLLIINNSVYTKLTIQFSKQLKNSPKVSIKLMKFVSLELTRSFVVDNRQHSIWNITCLYFTLKPQTSHIKQSPAEEWWRMFHSINLLWTFRTNIQIAFTKVFTFKKHTITLWYNKASCNLI